MKFAPGTPKSVIQAADHASMHGPKVDKTAPVRPMPVMPKGNTPISRPTVSGGPPPAMPVGRPALMPAGGVPRRSLNPTMMNKGGYVKNGGQLNLGSGRVSTATKNKKNPNF